MNNNTDKINQLIHFYENKWWYWDKTYTTRIGPFKSHADAWKGLRNELECLAIKTFKNFQELKRIDMLDEKTIDSVNCMLGAFKELYGYDPIRKYKMKKFLGAVVGIILAILCNYIYVLLKG